MGTSQRQEKTGALRKRHTLKHVFMTAILLISLFVIDIKWSKPSYAGCSTAVHESLIRRPVTQYISNRFQEHRTWFVGTFFTQQILPALMLFTEQMSAVAMQQTMAIGMFLDAKHQLETQRLLQELQVQAHIDYQPSEDFCWFGTNVKSLAASEQKSKGNAYALSRRQVARHLGEQNMGGASDGDSDKLGRWNMFLEHFCDPQDSDWVQTQPAETGLADICNVSDPTYTNIDIDYTRLVDTSKTLSVDEFGTGPDLALSLGISPADRALLALANNLYGHKLPQRIKDKKLLAQDRYQAGYLELRSVTAKRSVAENSFNAIVGMKMEGTPAYGNPTPIGVPDTHEFLRAILMELGIPDTEIREMYGARPSYYAQLEILSKKIFQNPDFYANLYDKPANVKRKSVALKALELMIEREIYESQIRQEMVSSVLLSTRLNEPFSEADKGLTPQEN